MSLPPDLFSRVLRSCVFHFFKSPSFLFSDYKRGFVPSRTALIVYGFFFIAWFIKWGAIPSQSAANGSYPTPLELISVSSDSISASTFGSSQSERGSLIFLSAADPDLPDIAPAAHINPSAATPGSHSLASRSFPLANWGAG